MSEHIAFFLLCFGSLFAVVNPISVTLVFTMLSAGNTKKWKHKMAQRATLTAALVFILFVFFGTTLFNVYKVSIEALQIGGGIIIMMVGIRMLDPQRLQKELHPESAKDLKMREDISLVPLAIPLMSGPGAIATTTLLTAEATFDGAIPILLLSIILVCALSNIILRRTETIQHFLGNSGIKAVEKILGLLILTLGVQYILNGITQYFRIGF
ncbi:hypothetical protein CMO92_00715 [Candidatus Woesearchaeota archaeon]|nr:hypothetical protein [Candidatus Woesearchaeota archaeon]|tara:strand:+ start:322 stop:957 length:636 start_codon:yes stop_codon:yes gene_type:complete